jgi:hypothetical protein
MIMVYLHSQKTDQKRFSPIGTTMTRRDGICYTSAHGAPIAATHIMRFDLQDVALRTLILVAGGLAALLLALKGQGAALPALAVGGTLGACVMARFGPGES